jgi:hypothetical protein
VIKRKDCRQFLTLVTSRIFRFLMEAFPMFWVNAFLLFVDDYIELMDAEIESDVTNQEILDRLRSVKNEIGNQGISIKNLFQRGKLENLEFQGLSKKEQYSYV